MCVVLGIKAETIMPAVAFVLADVNECENSDLCHSNGVCLNTPGSYMCSCKDGYSGNGSYCEGGHLKKLHPHDYF